MNSPRFHIALLSLCLISLPLYSQLTLSLATDKQSYSYGETIQVQLTLTNNTDSVISKYGSGTCFAQIGFDAIHFNFYCTATIHEFRFPPGQWMRWIWNLRPASLGLPNIDGDHIIRGFAAGITDSITVRAPKYYGGVVQVSFPVNTPPASMDSIRESLNVSVIYCDTLGILAKIHESWQVIGHAIDSVVLAYQGDPRFNYVYAYRDLFYDSSLVSSVFLSAAVPEGFVLAQNYPNPFNATTQINFTLPEARQVLITVYDLTGRLVSLAVDQEFEAGMHSVPFDASGLASGVYLYRLSTRDYFAVRTMILLK